MKSLSEVSDQTLLMKHSNLMSYSIFSILKLFVVALVAATFSLVPMASATHIDDDSPVACEVEYGEESHSESETNEHDHGDHAHQCGQCHVHILRGEPDASGFFGLVYDKERLLLSDGALSRSLSAFFRPPRR